MVNKPSSADMENTKTNGAPALSEVDGNKRKRKFTPDDTDIQNQQPYKRMAIHTTTTTTTATSTKQTKTTTLAVATKATTTTEYTSDTEESSSDCDSTVDFDGFPLGSPQTLSNILSSPPIPSPPPSSASSDDRLEKLEKRSCPLPALSWAEANDVWNYMCRKDECASLERNSSMLVNHPSIQPRMRAILLDWLIEVCEVYKLHRETYYLAIDYLDRYLSSNIKVSKTQLQLIGITCLFIAAKVEEIYPPKIAEFAYVTDGACQEDDILQQELLLLTALNWSVSPVTIIGWLSVYMQLNVSNRTPKSFNSIVKCRLGNNKDVDDDVAAAVVVDDVADKNNDKDNDDDENNVVDEKNKNSNNSDEAFIYPQFSSMEFAQAAQLLDLCTLDLGIANYPYSVIAAAAMVHTFNKSVALRVSGLAWEIVGPCVKWMQPFFNVIQEECSQVFLLEQNEQLNVSYGLSHICPNITSDDSHIIQTHTTSMPMFDKAMSLKEKAEIEARIIQQEASPAPNSIHSCSHGLLTPPASNRKFIDNSYNL